MVTSNISPSLLVALKAKHAAREEAEKPKKKAEKKQPAQPTTSEPTTPAAPIDTLPAAPKAPAPRLPESNFDNPNGWQAHAIETPLDLLHAHRPHCTAYRWQAQTLYQLAGFDPRNIYVPPVKPTKETPLYFNLVAANGSGKDEIVTAPFAVWFILTKIRSRCIITGSSYEQLKDQTFKYISGLCEDINTLHKRKVFEIIEFHIKCNDTGSEIKCFVTDDPGKAEGRHPFNDYPDSEMAVIINEAKSVADPLFEAFSRFTGYNYWIEISSPGTTSGHFWKRCTLAEAKWPQPMKLGYFYWRQVSAFECDHLTKTTHIHNLKLEHGETSLIYRSQVLAEFTSLDEAAYIPSTLFENYPKLAQRTFGLPTLAGLDFALGGDEMVLYVFRFGKLHLRVSKLKNAGAVVNQVISWIKEFNLEACNVKADDGGIGKPIIDRLEELGYAVTRVRNEARSRNPNFFKNRGAENWNRLKRLIEDRIFPAIEDTKTVNQLSTRGYEVRGIVTKLETKKEMKARGLDSPDRADALALCFDGIPISAFKSPEATITNDPAARFGELIAAQRTRPLTTAEINEFSHLFTNVVQHKPNPARSSLEETRLPDTNRGLFHDYIITQ